jgi:hypothetical protein
LKQWAKVHLIEFSRTVAPQRLYNEQKNQRRFRIRILGYPPIGCAGKNGIGNDVAVQRLYNLPEKPIEKNFFCLPMDKP